MDLKELHDHGQSIWLDYMRRELAIKVDFLDRGLQEQLQQLSNQRLKPPWAIDENEFEAMAHAAALFPRSDAKDDQRRNGVPPARGRVGQYRRRTPPAGHTARRATHPTGHLARKHAPCPHRHRDFPF